MQIPPRTHLEVDLDLLSHNAKALSQMADGREVMAVIKADAYAHGAVMVAREFTLNGICRFAVATLSEAMNLRRHRVPGELLILGYTDPYYAVELITQDITQTVVSSEHAAALSAAAVAAGGEMTVHIKIDSGLGRVGLDTQNADIIDELRAITKLPGLKVTGCFTHFAATDLFDESSDDYTRYQTDEFRRVTDAAKAAGINLGRLHACNSGGTLRFKDAYFDMIRPGSLVEGLDPMSAGFNTKMPFKPVATLKTVVGMVKELPAGRPISYGRTFYTEGPMRVATLPIGYADGFSRRFSNTGKVLINGEYAPVVGKVCMDQTMVDVTHIPDVKVGDTVTIFGTDGDKTITLNDMADMIGSMYVEVMSRLGRRCPVVYLRDGKAIGILDYMAGGLTLSGE